MSLYYSDDYVTLHHGDAFKLLPTFEAEQFAAVITDPPYTERTHSKARSNNTTRTDGIGEFTAITDQALRDVFTECGRISRGWVIATLDYKHAVDFDSNPPEGLKCQRLGVWVKTNPTPQITGDRPGQGWEAIAYLHREKGRSKWNGGGKHGNFITRTAQPEGHPTAKPLSMFEEFVRLFTNDGETILDPFAGSGTTLRAAKNLGRKAVGVELEERYCEVIARRCQQEVLDFGSIA